MPDASIRPIRPADWDGWKPLWDGYLHFYREELDDETTRFTFDRMCSESQGMFGFVADNGDELIGLVHALIHPSTWTTKSYCYLEDLFVSKKGRGTDVARQLIESVVKEAKSRGAVHTYWHTQEFNGAARSLYDQVARLTSFRVYER
ncbi:MAG: GNAT family N-acetyltransferase [Acidimicrobiales bacterium]|jgi:GNAT superfamily N-acetyltransferase